MFGQAKAYFASVLSFDRRLLIWVAVLMFFAAMMEGVGILLLVPLLNIYAGDEASEMTQIANSLFASVGIESDLGKVGLVLTVFLGLMILRNVIVWRRGVAQSMLSMGFVDHWRNKLFSALAHASWQSVSGFRQTDLKHAVMNDVSRISLGTLQGLQGVTALIMLVVQITVALYLSVWLTLIVLAFGVITGTVLWPLVKRSRVLGQRLTQRGQNMFAMLDQFLNGLKVAKVRNAEADYVASFLEASADARAQQINFQKDRSFATMIFQIFAGALACVVILVGLFGLKTDPTILIVFLFIQTRLIGPFQTLQTGLQSISNMLPAFESVGAMIERLEAESVGPQSATSPLPTKDRNASQLITFQDVSFAYEEDSDPVLDSLSLEITKGDVVVISGASGSGKTTFVDIVVGLLRPTAGRVLYSGQSLDAGAFADWRSSLAYLPQDPYLFDGTVRENLCWLNPDLSDEDIWRALEQVEAKDFIDVLPQKLDARVGERGASFSGGERQRLCLARALLQEPDLLILDEATNALDIDLEIRLLERLLHMRPASMTVMIITHRPAALSGDYKILSLVDGSMQLADAGNH